MAACHHCLRAPTLSCHLPALPTWSSNRARVTTPCKLHRIPAEAVINSLTTPVSIFALRPLRSAVATHILLFVSWTHLLNLLRSSHLAANTFTLASKSLLAVPRARPSKIRLADAAGTSVSGGASWCHQLACSGAKHGCSVGTQTEPQSILPPSSMQQRTLRTVLITENGMKSTKVFHSSTVCSTLNRSRKVTSFRQCTHDCCCPRIFPRIGTAPHRCR